jgi:hypothetical protein
MTPLDPSERFQVDDAFLAKVKQDAEWLLEKLGMEAPSPSRTRRTRSRSACRAKSTTRS